jgi:hypothetical protein
MSMPELLSSALKPMQDAVCKVCTQYCTQHDTLRPHCDSAFCLAACNGSSRHYCGTVGVRPHESPVLGFSMQRVLSAQCLISLMKRQAERRTGMQTCKVFRIMIRHARTSLVSSVIIDITGRHHVRREPLLLICQFSPQWRLARLLGVSARARL